jgi:hypothetical protein
MKPLQIDESCVVFDAAPAMFPGLAVTASGALANLPDGRIFALYYSYDEALPWRRYLAANILTAEP